jgi:hypothetical protein
MWYGRRFFDSRWKQASVLRGPLMFRHGHFQWKYTLYILSALGLSFIAFVGPTYWLTEQNYRIFSQLAYQSQPELVHYLEREIVWLRFFLGFSLLFTMLFCVFLGLRFTSRILRPIVDLERHMKKLTLGNWSAPDFRAREGDDFPSLIHTYGYLYRSLRANIESEIHVLQSLPIDSHHRAAINTLENLIRQKKMQLGIPTQHITPQQDPSAETKPQPLQQVG